MADNSVFITGAAKGAMADALDGLPPWATENTITTIRGILDKSLLVQKQTLEQIIKSAKAGGSQLTPSEIEKVNNEFEDWGKNLNEENIRQKKRDKEKELEDKKEKKRNLEKAELFGKRIAFDLSLAGVSKLIGNTFVENVKTFNDLNAAGINVISGMGDTKDGFQSLRQLTAETGVRFTELSASMVKYSSAVNSFGVGKFAKTVGMASANLTQFGFSAKEGADLLGAYLSMQQGVTDVSLKTADETNKDLLRFGESVFKLSMTTGMARTAIIANVEAISHSTDANVLAGRIGEQAAAGMTTFLASFKNQDVARQLLKLMSDPIKPLNETFMSLQKSGMGGFAQQLTTQMKSLEGMPEELKAQAMKSFVMAHRGELEQNKQRLALLKQAGVEGAAASLDMITALTQQADATVELTEEKRKEIERTKISNAASKNLATAWEKFSSLLQRAFGPTATMMNILTGALNGLNAVIGGIISAFDWLGEKISVVTKALGIADSFDLTAWIGIGIIGASLFTIFKSFKVGMLSAAKDLFSWGKGAKSASTSKGAGSLTEKVGGSVGGSLGNIGKGLGNLGKGLGAGLGGLIRETLTGLADGLKALGNPRVLLGVLALAGIAGALWITGKAIQQFTGLDWETMGKAGVALVALGVAGAAAGMVAPAILLGAAAFAAMGAALWIIGKAIDATGSGITTISSGLGNLSNVLSSFKGLDTLQTLVNTINSLEISKALTLGALSLVSLPAPTPTRGASSSTTPRSSTLNSPSAVSTDEKVGGEQAISKENSKATGTGIEKLPVDDGINTALGYQSSLLEQLLQGTNNLISVNKDILRYTRIQA